MSAIVKHEATSIAVELPQIFQLAKALSTAGGFMPRHIRNEGELVAVILAGSELGLPPMTSLRSIHLVEGRVVLAADTQLALMARAGISYEWTADGRSGTAQLRLKRPNMPPHVQTYSIDDAKQAGLAGKDNWRKHPAAMLRARCVSGAAKAYAPDVLSGVYIQDEVEEFQAAQTKPAQTATVDAEFVDEHGEVHGAHINVNVAGAQELLEKAVQRDEYGLAIPTSPCPVVTKDGPNKGKRWDELPGGLIGKMVADHDRMNATQQEWIMYLASKRQARKAREAAEKERDAAAADTSSEGGSWVAGDESPSADTAPKSANGDSEVAS